MKRDHYLMGLLIGTTVPCLTFALVWLLNSLLVLPSGEPWLDKQRLMLLALLPNVALIRYYLVNLKADKTGRVLVAITALAILAVFVVPNLMK